MNLIQQLEKEQFDKLSAGKEIPEFGPGDTVIVNVKVVEGDRSRVQAYEGVCIGRSGGGLNESFTVRKISYGEGVERVFPVMSPMIDSIKVVRRGKVRRAKLYYLRNLRGKSARIVEKKSDRRSRRRRRVIAAATSLTKSAGFRPRAFLLRSVIAASGRRIRDDGSRTHIALGTAHRAIRPRMVPDRPASLAGRRVVVLDDRSRLPCRFFGRLRLGDVGACGAPDAAPRPHSSRAIALSLQLQSQF